MDHIITEQKKKEQDPNSTGYKELQYLHDTQIYGLGKGRKNMMIFCAGKIKSRVIRALPKKSHQEGGSETVSQSTADTSLMNQV